MNDAIYEKNNQTLARYFKDKKIIITGATGLIGSRIAYFLDNLNYSFNSNIEIFCLYKDDMKKNYIFKSLKSHSNFHFYYFDSLEPNLPDFYADYIIHCAGISGGSKLHLTNPVRVIDVALIGTKYLFDFCVKNSIKSFLFVSSYEVYGNNSDFQNIIDESSPCFLDTMIIRNIYAEAKRLCESMGVAYSKQYGLSFYSGRLTSTFGNGVKYNDNRFFAEFARCYIENRDIVLKSKGLTMRSYLDADDAASAFLFILMNGSNCNSYNLANEENLISIINIAKLFVELSNNKIKVKFELPEENSSFRAEGKTVIDSTKLKELGWKPVYSFDETIIKLINSMKESIQ